jgi:antitoxin MazE
MEDDMRATIQKWGNSLALRIPRAFSRELGIAEATSVEMRVAKSTLIIKTKPAKKPELRKLVAKINEGNRHETVETGAAVGKEVW